MEEKRLTVERMRRRLATTGLIVATSLNVQETVDMLSLPITGVHQAGLVETRGKISS